MISRRICFPPRCGNCEKAEDPAAARAYIYGVICHFALDSECHPYVEKMIHESGISHSEIEMEFDRLLLKEDYINPLRYLATKHIRPTKENGAVIAPFFEDLTAETVQKALKGMIMYHKLLLAPGAVKGRSFSAECGYQGSMILCMGWL